MKHLNDFLLYFGYTKKYTIEYYKYDFQLFTKYHLLVLVKKYVYGEFLILKKDLKM
nr:hypothetical protein [Gaetbulibacter sp. 4G1]